MRGRASLVAMSTTRLLVLGAVRSFGRAHGYQIRRELLSWGSDEWANANPGSIYHALKQLTKEGLLSAQEGEAGPPRTDYEITEQGEAEFFRLLRQALSAVDPRPDMLAAGLGFLSQLPRDEAIALFRQRLEGLARWREAVAPHLADDGPAGPGYLRELLGLWVHSADSGADWTRGVIGRLEACAYAMADDQP